jgi:CSLREA domain-containing protein
LLPGGIVGVALAVAMQASSLQAQAPQPYDPRFDLTANGVIDGTDAVVAASSWSDLALDGLCATGPLAVDVSGDGCLDVADVQLLAERVGATGSEQPQGAPALAQGEQVWTVTSGGDDSDSNPGNGECRAGTGACTLRAALQEANRSVGPDRIVFDVRGANGSCPNLVTISPDSVGKGMLTLDDPQGYGTTIDGYTQCGASPSTSSPAGNAVIKVELRGRFDRDIHGLRVLSANNVVRGLALYNWDRQIEVYGGRARYNRVEGNFIGTNAAQSFTSMGMGTHHSEGLRLQIGATSNVVGCGSFDGDGQFVACADGAQAAAARNIVAGNGNDGIHLERNTSFNHVAGNYVGVKQDGATVLRNSSDGVDVEQGPQYNWIGGLTTFDRNVISGNGSDGIEVSHGTWTQFNHVAGNYFGLDASGTRAVPNGGNGISFEDRVDQNYAYNNHLSGNNQSGFRFYILATRNQVFSNVIGLAGDSQTPLPNRQHGIHVMGGSSHNVLRENVIAHNGNQGIYLASTSDSDHNGVGETYFNTISRNQIYANRNAGIFFFGRTGYVPNENIAAPTISDAATTWVEGRGCAGCTIEVFLSDKAASGGSDPNGEGRQFLGAGGTDGAGRFLFTISAVPAGSILTATTTDSVGNTSQFAMNVAAREAPPLEVPPTETPVVTPSEGPVTQPSATPQLPTPTTAPSERPNNGLWLPLISR